MTRAKPHVKLRFLREIGHHAIEGKMYRTVLFAPVDGVAHQVTMEVTDEVADALEPGVEYSVVKA